MCGESLGDLCASQVSNATLPFPSRKLNRSRSVCAAEGEGTLYDQNDQDPEEDDPLLQVVMFVCYLLMAGSVVAALLYEAARLLGRA